MNRTLIERTLAAMDKGYMGHHHAEYTAVMEALKQELSKVSWKTVVYVSAEELDRTLAERESARAAWGHADVLDYLEGTP